MKRLCLIIICAFFHIGNIMGEVEPFAVPGYPTIVVWRLGTINADYPAFWHTNYHTSEGKIYNLTYKILGDSIVNGETYGKMRFYYETREDLLTGMGLYGWGQPYGKTEFADTLLYRQEGDKVYCIPKGKTEEVLIVDYGLSVGDEFTDGSGETFRVTEARPLKDGFDWEWTTIGCCNVMCLYFYSEPKMLELVSTTTGERDTWVEGIGSLNWGVVPMFIAEGIKPFCELSQHPRRAQVCVAMPENMTVMPNVNEEDYKAMLVSDWKYAEEKDLCLEYSFVGNTLCVSGVQEFKSNPNGSYAECLITDNHIAFMLKQSQTSSAIRKEFCVRIPGFKAGTYEIGMPGQESVTLECTGANNEPVTFTEGQMATIILPTEPDASKGKYYRLDRVEEGKIIFEQEQQPRAHVPYIIVPDEDFSIDLSTLDLAGCYRDTVSVDDVSFIGSYVSEAFDYQDGFYIDIIDTTPDCRFDESCVIGALRAYLLVRWDDPYNQGGTKVPPLEKLEVVLRDYGTSIGEIKNEQLKIKNDVFDLSGRKIVNGQLQRGIYIENGQKKIAK